MTVGATLIDATAGASALFLRLLLAAAACGAMG